MLVGNYLNAKEVKDLISTFRQKEKFQNLIQEMQNHTDFEFNDEKIEVVQALKFDVVKNEDVISAKSVYLKVDEDVNIQYIVRHLNGEEDTKNDFFTGTLIYEDIEKDSLYTQLNFKARNDTLVTLSESSYDEDHVRMTAEVNSKEESEFPFDKDYYPGMLLDQVSSDAWYSGCLPGGYIWCGEKCGGSAACKSNLSGVNGLDNCCKAHDCCYSEKGVSYKDCYCDDRLCGCTATVKYRFSTPIVQAAMCFSC